MRSGRKWRPGLSLRRSRVGLDLSGSFLLGATVSTLLGVGMWVQLFMHRENWRRDLEQGAIWLKWRPLPPGLGLCVLLAIVSGWLVLRIFFEPLTGGIPFEEIPPSLLQALSLATFHLPATMAAFWWISYRNMPIREALGLRKPLDPSAWSLGFRGYFFALPALFIAGLLTLGVYRLLGRQPEPQLAIASLENIRHPAEIIAIFVLIAGIGPFCEEVLFRGVLFPMLTRRLGVGAGLVLHSLLFAAIHMHMPGFLSLFSLSIVLGLVYQRSQNLMSAFALHSFFNAMTLLIFFFGPERGGVL